MDDVRAVMDARLTFGASTSERNTIALAIAT